MNVKLLTEHHLEFLNLKGGCPGSSESTLVKMPHCWKSHVVAHLMTTSWVKNQIKQNKGFIMIIFMISNVYFHSLN